MRRGRAFAELDRIIRGCGGKLMNMHSIRAALAAAVVCAAGVAPLEPVSAAPRRGDRRDAARANADDVATLEGIVQTTSKRLLSVAVANEARKKLDRLSN